MPHVVCEYDLSSVFIARNGYTRSTVYTRLCDELTQAGWTKIQLSVWRKLHTPLRAAQAELLIIGNTLDLAFPANTPNGPVGTNHLFKRFDSQLYSVSRVIQHNSHR